MNGEAKCSPPCESSQRAKREGREGVFHGCLDEKGFSNGHSGAGIAGRADWLDDARAGIAVLTVSHGYA